MNGKKCRENRARETMVEESSGSRGGGNRWAGRIGGLKALDCRAVPASAWFDPVRNPADAG